MIKNVIIPEKIGLYYLFSQRIIGFDVGKEVVNATLIHAQGTLITLEKSWSIPLPAGTDADYADRASGAIKEIIDQCGKYDAVYTALSSAQAIFKELKLPFIGREKIELVIQYEAEPLLPFAASQGIIDFIITQEHPETKSSDVIVAAVPNKFIAQHLALFEAARVAPKLITIDLIALYQLYHLLPAYKAFTGGTVLIELEMASTRMEYISDGQLRLLRTLPKGFSDLIKSSADQLETTDESVREYLNHFGVGMGNNARYTQVIQSVFTQYIQEVSFTLRSFAQSSPSQTIHTILLFGQSSILPGLTQLVTDVVYIPCTIFETISLFGTHVGRTIKTNQSINPACTVSLAVALATPDGINLRKKEFAISNTPLLIKQLAVAAALVSFILLALFVNSFVQLRKLKKEANASQTEAVQALQERFPKIEENNLTDALDDAQREVEQEEKLWYPFSSAARTSFLKYLLELTTLLDKDALGLLVEKITFNEDTIILKAQVKGFEELQLLERTLRQSPLFSYIQPQNDPKFTMTIRMAKTAKGDHATP